MHLSRHRIPRYLAAIMLVPWLASPPASNPSIASPAPAPAVKVTTAWIRWLPAGLPEAGYLTLTNTGDEAIALKAASSPAFGDVSIHRSVRHGATEEMTPVAQITLKPHQTLSFESTGYHLMLMQPKASANPSGNGTTGDSADAAIPITLEFAGGSSLTVPFEVRKNPEVGPGAPPPLGYPAAARDTQVDVYHGIKVADPYRWLEDIDSADTRAWVSAEDRLSSGFLDSLGGRAEIAKQLRKIWNFERWSPPERYGHLWLYSHNDGLQNQSVVFVTEDPSTPGRVLIDPNTLSADGTVALRETAMSEDGKLFAYSVSDAGSDWQVWHVRNVATGKDLPDVLRWSKFGSASWRKDGSGFYYTAYDQPKPGNDLKSANEYQKLYFHRLGTPQSDDTLVYARTDKPDWFVAATVSDDGRYLVIQSSLGTDERNAVAVQDLTRPNSPIVAVIPNPTATFDVIGNVGASLLIRTDDSAPRYRIVKVDLRHPDSRDWRPVIPEGADTLDSATLVGGQLIVHRLKDAHSAVDRYTPDGRLLGTVELPGLGTAIGFMGHPKDTRVYYSYSSFSTPPSVFALDLSSGKTALWRSPRLEGFTPSDYETHQVFYSSKDGTRVPMFITARKGTPLSGNNPTILYGYGGFNVPVTPEFTPRIAEWLEIGGVYAVANLRGGGEYGRAWHEAGMKTHKQNVFDDFIAAAEYLSNSRWTRPGRLALSGRSNGGLLIGAVEEQRPDIAAAAIPEVGVMDMLRFRKFTVGKAWESDYGSVDDAAEFRALYAYSPYHNVKSGVSYPATLIMTGDHDDRVFPAHSFKFAAAMQHADPRGNPILLRVETRAGHGQGIPTAKLIDEVVDIYAFILHAFGMTAPAAAGRNAG